MGKIKIPDVTLIAPTGLHVPETVDAIKSACKNIEFGAVVLVAPEKPDNCPDYIMWDKCTAMDSYMNYNQYVFSDLYDHVFTSHCLLIQYDAGIIHEKLWNDNWLQYDYIGAPWAWKEDAYIAWGTGEHVRVGNGGFSLRSKKLLEVPRKKLLYLTQEKGYYNEDGNICCYHREAFLNAGIKFAPLKVAARFSFENIVPENMGLNTFGYHKNRPPYIGF